MKKFIFLRRIFLLVVFIQLTGCQKFIDRIFPGHNNNTGCRIREIDQGRIGTFYYNAHSDLDSVIFDIETGSAGAQFFYFIYDPQHRLIAYNAYYRRGNYYFKHNYVYSDEGKVIIDTARIRQSGSWTQVTFPEYDSQGKVIRETGKYIEAEGDSTVSATDTILYNYDQHGNLQPNDNTIQYDDKSNYLSTNRVLMFTERNYSNNNPTGAIGYNQQGLPLGFSIGSLTGGLLQWGLPSEIKYDCGNELREIVPTMLGRSGN